MTPSALFSPAPFGAGPAIVLTAIVFQSVITAGSAAAGGWTADADSAAVNAPPMTSAASTAAKPSRLPMRTFITPPSPRVALVCHRQTGRQTGRETDHPPVPSR